VVVDIRLTSARCRQGLARLGCLWVDCLPYHAHVTDQLLEVLTCERVSVSTVMTHNAPQMMQARLAQTQARP
jgi:hypothetical protein